MSCIVRKWAFRQAVKLQVSLCIDLAAQYGQKPCCLPEFSPMPIVCKGKQQIFWWNYANAQAYLKLCCSCVWRPIFPQHGSCCFYWYLYRVYSRSSYALIWHSPKTSELYVLVEDIVFVLFNTIKQLCPLYLVNSSNYSSLENDYWPSEANYSPRLRLGE